MTWYRLTSQRATVLAEICEQLIPGSAPTGPAVYIDSKLTLVPPPLAEAVEAAIDRMAGPLGSGGTVADVTDDPAFGLVRALTIEAYYSGFRQPGYDGPSAWQTTGFVAAPMAQRAKLDFSYLPCFQEVAP